MVERDSYQMASPGKDTPVEDPKPRSFFLTALPFYVLAHCAHHLLTALPTPLLPFIRKEFSFSCGSAGPNHLDDSLDPINPRSLSEPLTGTLCIRVPES